MSDSYIKLVSLLKRKQGISVEEFQHYYENNHAKLISLLPGIRRYMRRYLMPLQAQPVHFGKPQNEPEFDVITELWFDSRDDVDAFMARLAEPDIARTFAEDEEKLFDRSWMRAYVLKEHESDMDAA